MDVEFTQQGGKINILFLPGEKDGVYNQKIKMKFNKVTCNLGENFSIDEIHNDHLALAALLISNPFVGEELSFNFPISERFYETTKRITKFSVKKPNEFIEPYRRRKHSKPGLAFSGGADSTAALLLMPKNTLAVFMDRPLKIGRSLYNKSAAYATIEHAISEGYDVRKVKCDLEYVRSPIGFPTDLAPSVPLVLMAAKENLDCIAFGTVLESAFRVGHENSRNYNKSAHYRVWGGLFASAGLRLYLPVSGISEVCTSYIVMNSSFYDFTRSCIRGNFPKSCQNCWKCFRKNLIDKRLKNEPVTQSDMERWLRVKEVKHKLKSHPISHENVLSWSLQGQNSNGEIKQLLMNRMEGSIRNMDFLFSWYSPAITLIPEDYRDETEKRILKYLDKMDPKYHDQITGHAMTEWLNSENAQRALGVFSNLMKY